ncbi:hypothetical protein QZH41_014874, partial [Actinostola sp. cb2023]
MDGTEEGRMDGTEEGRMDGTEEGRMDGTEEGRMDGTEEGGWMEEEGRKEGKKERWNSKEGRKDGTEKDTGRKEEERDDRKRNRLNYLTCQPLFSECNAAEPSILVKVHFSVSWREMCDLETYLKENFAKQIVTNTGSTLSTDRMVLYKFADSCQPQGSYNDAVVSIFVVKPGSNRDMANIDVEMTKKLFKVLHYLYEQNQERYLGNLFVGKIKNVEVTGKDAPKESTAYTEVERLYIGLGVGLAVIVLIIIITVAVT